MSPLEHRVTQAVGQVQPNAAVDFGVIMQIMSMVLQFIQQCPFGNARRAIRESAVEAKVATYRAVKSSGYGGNPVDLTNALLEQGRQATDAELDETIASAHALPALRTMLLTGIVCLALGAAVHAGPFPDGLPMMATRGPFPEVGDRTSEVRNQMSEDGIVHDSAPPASLNPESRILNPSLRDRIAAYRARGGGIVGVRGMTITTHMLRDHGWSESQLAGLSTEELSLLHGMQHAGQIEPGAEVSAGDGRSATGHPVRISGGSAQWVVDGITWSNLGGGSPVEGQVYRGGGRAFVYRGGRMYAADAAASPCAGGRCPMR
ncbi:MAG: hypothetical protein JNG89_06025 [Planctomycetaceae bacterium]|nr:hypothetical protein [Planctomycetaceae bacterium]